MPRLPRPPRPARLPSLSSFLREINPVRQVIDDARESIRAARESIGDIAGALRVEESYEPEKLEEKEETKVGVSDSETLQYQLDHLLDELNLIETHFAEKGRIAGKPCDCIAKAARRIKAYAQETIPIATRQGKESEIYSQIAAWAREMQEIGTEAAVASGKYDDRYLVESGTASTFRKALQTECLPCAQMEDLKDFIERKRKESRDSK